MEIFGILIACGICWFIVLLALNFYYDAISQDKPENITLRATLISIFIMSSLLFLAYCK